MTRTTLRVVVELVEERDAPPAYDANTTGEDVTEQSGVFDAHRPGLRKCESLMERLRRVAR